MNQAILPVTKSTTGGLTIQLLGGGCYFVSQDDILAATAKFGVVRRRLNTTERIFLKWMYRRERNEG